MPLDSSGVYDAFDPLEADQSALIGPRFVHAFLDADIYMFADLPRFSGAGLYGLYYLGPPLPYAPDYPCDRPVYCGKALPSGSRKGKPRGISSELYSRIRHHRRNILAVEQHPQQTLRLDDFMVRWLVTTPIWIAAGESKLIEVYQPLWNTDIDGFGNNDLGKRRKDSEISQWDKHHPGRLKHD